MYPPRLIAQAVQHLEKCKAAGILVAPMWKASSFWPFLFSWRGPARAVKDCMELKYGARYLRAGNQLNSIFTPTAFKDSLIAVFLDATSS